VPSTRASSEGSRRDRLIADREEARVDRPHRPATRGDPELLPVSRAANFCIDPPVVRDDENVRPHHRQRACRARFASCGSAVVTDPLPPFAAIRTSKVLAKNRNPIPPRSGNRVDAWIELPGEYIRIEIDGFLLCPFPRCAVIRLEHQELRDAEAFRHLRAAPQIASSRRDFTRCTRHSDDMPAV
jgi:hypothetical protein